MAQIQCQTFTLTGADIASVTAAVDRLDEFYCDGLEGILVGSVDEVVELFHRAQETGLAIRFHDEGFPLVTVWQWLGMGTGLAYILRDGRIQQVNLMLAGLNSEAEHNAVEEMRAIVGHHLPYEEWRSLLGGQRPMLATFTSLSPEEDGGGFLLGMILFAAFSEACGLP